MAYREVEIDREICLGCGKRVPRGTDVCDRCGSPINAARFAEMELTLKPALQSARRSLALAAGLALLQLAFLVLMARRYGYGFSWIGRDSDPTIHLDLDLILQVNVVALYAVCLARARRRPYGALLVGLAAYVAVQIAGVIADPFSLTPGLGFLVRMAIVVTLVRGVRAGYRARDLQRQARPYDRKLLVGALVLAGLLGIALGQAERAANAASFYIVVPISL